MILLEKVIIIFNDVMKNVYIYINNNKFLMVLLR